MEKNYPNILSVALGGALILTIIMGVGRFAYTPILPLMQETLSFSTANAGYLASVNFLGYLLGSLGAGLINWKGRKTFHLRFYLILNIISTIAMGLTENFFFWGMLRFISGMTSGLTFVLASSIVLDILAVKKKSSWSGIFYSGVGLGIFLSGILTPILNWYLGWKGAWLGLGLLCLALTYFVWDKAVEMENDSLVSTSDNATIPKQSGQNVSLRSLIIVYGLQGLGYIISGTFLVAIISEKALSFDSFPSIVWALVGLAAAPSCVLWVSLAKRWGNINALIVAYLLQALAIIMPVVSPTILGAAIGGLLYGGTFMGIVTLVISTARNMYPNESSKAIGYLTFAYAVGQIFGPTIAGIMTTSAGSYTMALIFSAGCLLLGAIILAMEKIKNRDELVKVEVRS